jgi:hypothetical protein
MILALQCYLQPTKDGAWDKWEEIECVAGSKCIVGTKCTAKIGNEKPVTKQGYREHSKKTFAFFSTLLVKPKIRNAELTI